MYYVYVIYSHVAGKKYTGFTSDLNSRIEQHNLGFKNSFTTGNGPWALIYFEEFETEKEARQREKYLKTGAGRDFIKAKTSY